MNRELKFRAWDKTNRRIFVAHAINFNKGIVYEVIEVGTQRDPFSKVELMQFTGLKDKNGKEIYEGDIVEDNGYRLRYQIIFEDGEFRLDGKTSFSLRGIVPFLNDYEIIGNIYENPELLEKKK